MTDAKRDNNHVTTALGVSSVDGVTPVPFQVDPATGRLLTDASSGGYTNLTQFVDQTAWRLFYSNSSGDVTELALGASGTVLTSNGATSAPTFETAGAGDVVGPASATDNALARFDTTTGKLLQDGTVSSSDVAAGAVTVASIGDNNLKLQTGNATTGSITITDGADGNIDIAPNGTGDVRLVPSGAGGVYTSVDVTLDSCDLILGAGDISINSGNGIVDSNLNEQLFFTTTASAVNYLNVTNAATGNAPVIAPGGTDATINLNLEAKGVGGNIVFVYEPDMNAGIINNAAGVQINNGGGIYDGNLNELVKFTTTASAVNELTITNAATGNSPTISTSGSNTDIDLTLAPKGAGSVVLGGELDAGANSIGFTMQTATGDGTTTVDWKLGNHMDFTFGAFNETFTFTAPTKSGVYTMSLKQDSVGSRTATWPATVKWPAGTAPTLTTTATTGYDVVSFRFDGTNYYGTATLDFS